MIWAQFLSIYIYNYISRILKRLFNILSRYFQWLYVFVGEKKATQTPHILGYPLAGGWMHCHLESDSFQYDDGGG